MDLGRLKKGGCFVLEMSEQYERSEEEISSSCLDFVISNSDFPQRTCNILVVLLREKLIQYLSSPNVHDRSVPRLYFCIDA